MGVVGAHAQAVVGVGGLISLPAGAFHKTIRFVVDVLSAFLFPGLRDAVAPQVIGIRIRLVLAVLTVHKLIQLIVLVINVFVLYLFIRQVAERIVGVGGQRLCDIAAHHPVQFVVGVDVRALLGFVRIPVRFVFCTRIRRFLRPVRIVPFIRLLPAVQARRRVSAVVDNVSVFIHVLSRRNLAAAVAPFEAFRAVGVGDQTIDIGTANIRFSNVSAFCAECVSITVNGIPELPDLDNAQTT